MAVSIIEGNKAERIATALEALARGQSSSEAAAQAAQEAREAAATAQEVVDRISSLAEQTETLERLADDMSAEAIGVVSFMRDQTEPVYDEDGITVKYAAITPAQQETARINIGLGDINAMVSGSVKYDADQTESLTSAQKTQARENISAASAAELESLQEQLGDIDSLTSGSVKIDVDQTAPIYEEDGETIKIAAITSEQQATARNNIDAASRSDVEALSDAIDNMSNTITGVVKYTDQVNVDLPVSAEEQATARNNIGAASAADLNTTNTNLQATRTLANSMNQTLSAGVVTSVGADNNTLTFTYSNNETDSITIPSSIANVDYDENSQLHFYDADGDEMFQGPFTIQGGGGSVGYTARISNGLGGTSMTVASNQESTQLKFTYTEFYAGENTGENGYLTVQYKYSTESDDEWATLINRREIQSGVQQTVDVNSVVVEGSTLNVRVICNNGRSGEDAITKTLVYNITCVSMSIRTTFDHTATYTGNLTIPYVCVGRNLKKTVYLHIDGTEYTHVDIGTSHNQSLQLSVSLLSYEYGAHKAELWFETPEGAKSNVLHFPILYNNGSSAQPIVGARLVDDTIENGDQLDVRYVCYTPGSETTSELTITVYQIENDSFVYYYTNTFNDIPNNTEQTLILNNYPALGEGFILFASGETEERISFTVSEIQTEYDINSVESGLIYSYKPIGYTNTATDRDTYVYIVRDEAGNERNIYTTMDDFNWVTDGYLDGESLTLSGGARMNINLPLFTTSFRNEDNQTVVLDATSGATVTTSGRTAEFEFEISNVTDQNATVFSCMDSNGVGFVITPQVCYLCSDGQAPDFDDDGTGFIENEENLPCAYIKDDKRIRVSFVVQRKRTVTGDDGVARFVSSANIFINGEYANSFLYDEGAVYNGSAIVTIGSDHCTTKIYDIRMYNRDLNKTEVLQNHMNSDVNLRKRIAENEHNNVLEDSGTNIDYNKAKYKYPCLLFIGPLSNFKEDEKRVGVVLTKPKFKTLDDGTTVSDGYTTEFSLLDKDEAAKFVSTIKVQGTSSQRFMRKNFKVKLQYVDKDGQGNMKLDSEGKAVKKKLQYALKGYDNEGNALSIGESTLCFKMDYMSTDHANTFNSNIADTLFNDKPNGSLVQNTVWGFRCLLFNMDAEDYVEGRAFEDYAEGVIKFAGDGCLNNDKSNSKSFGLEDESDKMSAAEGLDTLQQKWEFKDNSQDPCTFKTDQLQKKIYSQDDNGGTVMTRAVKYALESCYPDEGDLEDEGLEPNYDHIQVLFSWVCQRANFWDASTTSGGGIYNNKNYANERELKKAIFINEFERHFNMEHALVYYIFIEWVALCDNRAKNMFLSCKDIRSENIVFKSGATALADCINDETGEVDISKIDWDNSTFGVWYCDLYDLDSCFGAENSGYIRIPYYADWQYKLGDDYQFNGHDSRLWCMFEEAFADRIKARAQSIVRSNTGSGALNYNVLKQVHITDNAELVCPAIVNKDMEYKYEDAWTEGYWDYSEDSENPKMVHTSDYKYLQRGSRTEQKESFIYRRSNMLYSKYQCDPFLNDQILFRCGDAVELTNASGAQIDDSVIELKAVQAMWMGVTYGDSGLPQMSSKKNAGEKATFRATNRMGRSDHVHIHGASQLTDVSSLAKFKPYEIGLTSARKLKTLLIGSNEAGYSNANLTSLGLDACVLLDTLNVQNCTGLTNPVDLTKNTLIRKVYAGGSAIPYFTFANGGILDTLEVGSPTRIVLRNQSYLQNFSYDNLDNLLALRVEGTPNVKPLEILKEKGSSLRLGIRLIDINETLPLNDSEEEDRSIFTLLTSSVMQGKQMNANGDLVSDEEAYPIITGVIHCTTIGEQQLRDLNRIYPNLTIDYAEEPLPQHLVTFVNPDGTTVKDRQGNDYVQYVEEGRQAYDPVAAGEIDEPTMEADDQYSYVFNGNWTNLYGVVMQPKTVTAQYDTAGRSYTIRWFLTSSSQTPIKTAHVSYGGEAVYGTDYPTRNGYLFNGWNKSTGYVTSDMDVYAKWITVGVPVTKYRTPGDETSGLNPDYVPLKNMTPVQICAVSKYHDSTSTNHYWDVGDYIDIEVGTDFDFTDPSNAYTEPGYVKSELLAKDLYTNRSRIITTTAKLFAEGAPSFTMAIDYEFAEAGTGNDTLVACFDPSGQQGFRLYCSTNGSPMIAWGDKQITVGNTGLRRGIVVLQYIAGQNNLFVAANNVGSGVYNMSVVTHEGSRTQSTTSNAVVTFGGAGYGSSGAISYGAAGTVHWCKVWYGALGVTAAKQLANWTHETWRMKYAGENRHIAADGTGLAVAATFIADAPLAESLNMSENSSSTSTNTVGRTNTFMFINSRCLYALPILWQQIVKPVQLNTTTINNNAYNTSVVASLQTKIYIPAGAEITSTNLSSRNSNYAVEGSRINWFTSNVSRAKFAGIQLPEDHQVITESTDPSSMTTTYSNLKDGDVWVHSANGNYIYVYVSPTTAAKHAFLGNRAKTSDSNIVASTGGVWVLANEWWTRTPMYNNSYFYAVSSEGVATTGTWYSRSQNKAITLMFDI